MTTYTHKPDSGSIFKNERKRPDRQDPDYTGQAEIGGRMYYVDGWVNEVQNKPGRKYLRLKFKEAQFKPDAPAKAAETPPKEDDFNDDIPF